MMKRLLVMTMFAALAVAALPSHAQSYPSRPIRYVVAFSAGDSPDIVARLIGDRLSRIWEQQVLVENRTGAGGTIAGNFVAKSAPDGYTLFHCNIASNAIFVHPSMPIHSIKDFIDYAKANPGKLSYGHGGVGASPHLTMELFRSLAHIDLVNIAYKGASPAMADLLGGQIPAMISNVPASLPYVQSGKIRALAVTSAKRISQLASVPTMIESGFPGFQVTSWYGMCAPAGTPVPILDKLHTDLVKVLQMPEVVQRFTDLVVEPVPQSREEFGAFLRDETARWAKVAKDAHIPVQ